MLIKLGRDGATVIALLTVAIWTDWLWTIIALTAIPVIFIPVRLIQILIRKRSRQLLEANASLTKHLDESFHGIRTIQMVRIEDRELDRFNKLKNLQLQKAIQAMIAKASIPLLMSISAGVGCGLVLFYGGLQITDGTRSVGQLMSFFTALGLLIDPMRRLAVFSATWQSKLASLERTFDLLQINSGIKTRSGKVTAVSQLSDMSIVFKNVSFKYNSKPIVNSVSFRAPTGKITAIVGPSGAGKTTIMSLMTRFVEPDFGSIEIGGVDIRDLNLAALRGLFGVVSQETALFDDTIRDNILLGRTDISKERLEAALDYSNVVEFLPKLEHGIDTLVGPRGSALSGGQRQRVIIARAILSDAPILLLDEATSSLDSRSEELVQQSLDRLSQVRTTIVIAHRLSTVRNADQIIVMNGGCIVEHGTHEYLWHQQGLYFNMCRTQPS